MGTRNHPSVPNQPYAVTAVTNGRVPVFRDRQAAGLMLEEVARARRELWFLLLAYAIMPDHVHLLIVPGRAAELSRIMQTIKGRFARLWNKQMREKGRLWQPRYYESAVRTEPQLRRWIEYIEANPVRARLSASPKEYCYSSAGGPLSLDVDVYLHGVSASRAEARPSEVTAGRNSTRKLR